MTRFPAAFLTLALALALVAGAARAEVETRVARKTVGPGETVDLLLRLRGADAAHEPDWSQLGPDFDLVDARRTQRTSIVNGVRDESVDWSVALAPRRTGDLEIPSLPVGSSHSDAIGIVVAESGPDSFGGNPSGAAGAPAPAVSLQLDADDTSPYVQGRVLLTARILAGPDLIEGQLSDPEVEGAVLERVGEDTTYRRSVNGEPGVVIERRYAVFPQRSGTVTIPPLVFEGRVRDTRPPPARSRPGPGRRGGRSLIDEFFGGDPFGGDPFGDDFFAGGGFGGGFFEDFFAPRARSVRALSQAVTLDVKPKPAAAGDQWWIPARSLEILERWETEPPVFRVGEPVTRTVAIRATGLSGAQLPDLSLPPVDGAKQYTEPSQDQTTTTQDEVVAVKALRTSLIPTAEGPLTLPAVEVEWWDTRTDEPRTARLEERVVQVLPGSGVATPATPAQVASAGSDPANPAPAVGDPPRPLLPGPPWAQVAGGVGIGLAGAALAFALVTARRRRAGPGPERTSRAGAAAAPAAPAPSTAERALRRACRDGNSAGASAALRELARARWPEGPPQGPGAWERLLDSPELGAAIADLDRVRYSRDASEWRGDDLWQAYRRAGRRRSDPGGDRARSDSSETLPALYPSH